jgi:hypothetical protein
LWEIVQQNIFWLIIVAVILLLVSLLYHLKLQIRQMVKNEIYEHFPSIKQKVEECEFTLHHLQLQADEWERRVRELKQKK